jgi:hypothetical protein
MSICGSAANEDEVINSNAKKDEIFIKSFAAMGEPLWRSINELWGLKSVEILVT